MRKYKESRSSQHPVASQLINWYNTHGRDLPWRRTKNPYYVWISEVILQQTRIAQGIDYYHKFIKHFPDVLALASANEEEVLKVWQGLGYYSRARNLHKAAKSDCFQYNGKYPLPIRIFSLLKEWGLYSSSDCFYCFGNLMLWQMAMYTVLHGFYVEKP